MGFCEKQKVALSEGLCWAGRAPPLFAQDVGKAAFLMGRAILNYPMIPMNYPMIQEHRLEGSGTAAWKGHTAGCSASRKKTPPLSGLLLRGLHLLSLCLPKASAQR